MKEMLVYSGSASQVLTKKIISHFSFSSEGHVHLGHFPDGEIEVQLLDNARGRDVFIVQSMNCPTNDNLMELLIMIDAAKRASASRVTAVIPYFGYARQDRKDKPRVPITAKLVSNMLTAAGVDRILTIDLHSHQIQGFFDIPVDHLYARPVLYKAFKTIKEIGWESKEPAGENIVMVAPDTSAAKEIYKYADTMDCGFAIVGKERKSGEESSARVLVGDVENKIVIMVDDMTSTCGTLINASEIVKEHGAKKIYAAVTHNLITDTGIERLKKSPIDTLITTDTVDTSFGINDKVFVISVSHLIAKAIYSTYSYESVSCLFEIEEKD
jgi:ribose-phosphate pyrophosphokinase